jgi:cyclopropane fatty-acyl-phospholipid synthase-like methyltransferase
MSEIPRSEADGLRALEACGALNVYSVGVSTAGEAEIRMAHANPARHILATTIDEAGLRQVGDNITAAGLNDQITTKLEDVTADLPYSDGHFDFIYARLVLHYLDRNQLEHALANLYRVAAAGCQLYVVVRSTNSEHYRDPIRHDHKTGMTTYHNGKGEEESRYFHDAESLHHYLTGAGWEITQDDIQEYPELIYADFARTVPSKRQNVLASALATKPVA